MEPVTLSISDLSYPAALRQGATPPAVLYGVGNLALCAEPLISIVGSRHMTSYGERVLRVLVPPLVAAGLHVVSGLAYGIDAEAHRIALKSGGSCVAVLPCPLDNIYPPSNRPLLRDIIKRDGCALTELAAGAAMYKSRFIERNRLVAWLSPVILIIEAGERSGTLSTARFALEAGREVCVVPGDIGHENSKGVHDLLKQGARPVTGADDVLALYGQQLRLSVPDRLRPALTGSLATLYDLISQGKEGIDELMASTGLSVSGLHNVLSVLELDGYIYNREGRWRIT